MARTAALSARGSIAKGGRKPTSKSSPAGRLRRGAKTLANIRIRDSSSTSWSDDEEEPVPDETMEAESDPDEEEKIEEEEIVPERVIGVCRVWKEFYSEASGSNGQGSKARWYEGIVARLERVRGELLYLVVYHDGDQEHVNVERLRDMRRVEPDPKRVGAGWKVDWSKRYE